MLKYICIFILTANFLYSKSSSPKFLVVDSDTYLKINVLNILNGGIKKRYLIASSRLTNTDIEKYYQEYFLYNAEKCNIINELIIGQKNIKFDIKNLISENEIKKEIKKIKLLQMLVDNESKLVVSHNISPKIIKSLGYICADKLIFKNKTYKVNDEISNFFIKVINSENNTIRLGVK